jgi:TetR/AcrR family transcriptional regulator, regulator of cefoperazone and chloramphenicol sensitivity
MIDPAAYDATRDKLLEAAGQVFAEHGYHSATVREICMRAGANVAAVNYHFGDKLELYTEVLRRSVGAAQNEAIRNALDQEGAPEEILRQVIKAMVRKISGDPHSDRWFRLIVHELAQPTPAMSRVIDEAIRPIYNRLRQLIGAILTLPRDHEKTRLCTHSIVGQIVHYPHARRVVARLWPDLKMTPEQLDRIADHIADFSLAYLASARPGRRQRASTRHSSRRK